MVETDRQGDKETQANKYDRKKERWGKVRVSILSEILTARFD